MAGADSIKTKARLRYSVVKSNNDYDLSVTPENYIARVIGSSL